MTVAFPEIRVGDAVRSDNVSVFPLFGEPAGEVDYVLSDEAIERESITVKEVSESGSVPDLLVENQGEDLVLFLEGEELVGAKQNRILNTSVLVAAGHKLKIPVSCVEQGRWGYRSRKFQSGGTHSPSKLRHYLKASVACSLKEERGHRSDQSKVWAEVERQQEALGSASPTSALSDTFADYQERRDDFRDKIRYVEGATGVAVAVGEQVVACDLFDKPATCKRVWDRLLSGYVLDAVEAEKAEKQAQVADVQRLLSGLEAMAWESVEPVGEGKEYRAESPSGDHLSALAFDEVLVHGSAVCPW